MGEIIDPEMVTIAVGLRVLIVEDEAHRPDENKESSYLFEIELQSEVSNEKSGDASLCLRGHDQSRPPLNCLHRRLHGAA